MLAPTTYEQRKPFYEDLQELIVTGFLTHTIEINNSILSIRNLSSSDNFFIKHTTRKNDNHSWMLWSVARSVWMIDGLNLLGEKNAPYHTYQLLQQLPQLALTKMMLES